MSLMLNGVSRRFGGFTVLDRFSLTLEKGRIHCFFGPSGCGKTTLLHVLAGLQKPDGGAIAGMQGLPCSFVFQEDRLLPWLTVRENVTFVLEGRMERREADAAALRVLERVGLLSFRDSYPDALSGGMKQRVSWARAMAYGGELLMMDEPFKGLDRALKLGLMEDLLRFAERDRVTVLLVTHDREEALLLADTIYMLQGPPLSVSSRLDIPVPKDRRRWDPAALEEYAEQLR